METTNPQIRAVADATLGKAKYHAVQRSLVERLAAEELGKGRKTKEAVKEVSARLHQAGSAYLDTRADYPAWLAELTNLPADSDSTEVRTYCLRHMRAHASTRERLPILEEFFQTTLESIAPLESVLDLACGLNPLALPWMPLSKGARYDGCDIFSDMIHYLNRFTDHMGRKGSFATSDLTQMQFSRPAKAAFLLKTLPVMEQLEKGISARLLEEIPADYLLISYPIRSLGGRSKGMGRTYEHQFDILMKDKPWQVKRFEFKSELAFLVKK